MQSTQSYAAHLFGKKILITGSSGLIGTGTTRIMKTRGANPLGFDVRATGSDHGDVLDYNSLCKKAQGCSGIIHLAAVSRVVTGEQNPQQCLNVNINGLSNVIRVAETIQPKPWLIFASSREVYGEPETFPVNEDHPQNPINTYGHTKQKGEQMVGQSTRDSGLAAAILRFSNVFGSPDDYPDRVIPAFLRAALCGDDLRVDGAHNLFDFTYLDDVCEAIWRTANLLELKQQPLPPIHLVSGVQTSLFELASQAIQIMNSTSRINVASSRNYDVHKFVGNTDRADKILGWRATTSLHNGLTNLGHLYQQQPVLQP